MARKKTPATSEPKLPTELLIPRDEAKSRLLERIQKGRELKQIQINSPKSFDAAQNEYYKWDSFNAELLKRIFSTDELSEEYNWFAGIGVAREYSLGEKISDLHEDIDNKIHRIDSIIERRSIEEVAYSIIKDLKASGYAVA